jgi:hypothetical protein
VQLQRLVKEGDVDIGPFLTHVASVEDVAGQVKSVLAGDAAQKSADRPS